MKTSQEKWEAEFMAEAEVLVGLRHSFNRYLQKTDNTVMLIESAQKRTGIISFQHCCIYVKA
jgi:hypothetical protein